MDGEMYVCIYAWMDGGWMEGWMDGWMIEWMDGWKKLMYGN